MIRQRGKGELRMDSGSVLMFFHRAHASNVTALFNKNSYQPAERESRATDNHISTPREPIYLKLVTFMNILNEN